MAENDKDKDFEFIEEQVVEKKPNKIKKRLIFVLTTLLLAVLFGLTAAFTFVITEPGFYKYLHKEDEPNTQANLPTTSPVAQNPDISIIPDNYGDQGGTDNQNPDGSKDVQPNIEVQRINANLSDIMSMSYELRKVAYEVNKSIVNVVSTFLVKDWFNNTVEKPVNTTGIIVDDNATDLFILVSLDRVNNANYIKLKFSDKTYVNAVLLDYESEMNLAMISVKKEDIPSIYLSSLQVAYLNQSYAITVGNPIIALGCPNGHLYSMETGIITSKGSWISITDNRLELFNTSIEDNLDSDGVIVNLKGEVIGIITRTLKEDINQYINTAISIDKIRTYIRNMENHSPRIYFGIKSKDMTEDVKQKYNVANGIYVSEVQTGSPAFNADIKSGDIILFVNNKTVLNSNSFYEIISKYAPSTEIIVKIKRTAGNTEEEKTLTVILGEKPQR